MGFNLPTSNPVQAVGAAVNTPLKWITDGRAALDSSISNFLLTPFNSKGIGGFLFDYDAETQINVESEITDHYTESNNFFSDHQAHKPLEIQMRGFVGELVAKPGNYGLAGAINLLQSKLTTLDATLGKYTPQAATKIAGVLSQASNAVNKVDNLIDRAKNIVGLFGGANAAPTKQQQAFSKLMALRDTSQVFTLDTPFGLIAVQDPSTGKPVPRLFMIRHLVFIQPEETNYISDIAVTLKEIRFAGVQLSDEGLSQAMAAQNNAGRAALQRQFPVNKGQTSGLPTQFTTFASDFGKKLRL